VNPQKTDCVVLHARCREADTVHGRRRQGVVLSLVERTSRRTRLTNLPRAMARLRYRPRKCLDFLTPCEVFNNTRLQLTVALRG
jgi:IS30 family transposase